MFAPQPFYRSSGEHTSPVSLAGQTERPERFETLLRVLKERVSIIDVADLLCGPMKLKPLPGNRWIARCPLLDHHSYGLPSFVVYKDENRWRCYGCGCGGGDVLHLYQLGGGYTDKTEALADLASEYGVNTTVMPKDRLAYGKAYAAAEREAGA